jgi:hypothetical protein
MVGSVVKLCNSIREVPGWNIILIEMLQGACCVVYFYPNLYVHEDYPIVQCFAFVSCEDPNIII